MILVFDWPSSLSPRSVFLLMCCSGATMDLSSVVVFIPGDTTSSFCDLELVFLSFWVEMRAQSAFLSVVSGGNSTTGWLRGDNNQGSRDRVLSLLLMAPLIFGCGLGSRVTGTRPTSSGERLYAFRRHSFWIEVCRYLSIWYVWFAQDFTTV